MFPGRRSAHVGRSRLLVASLVRYDVEGVTQDGAGAIISGLRESGWMCVKKGYGRMVKSMGSA